jgi:hypothetical protein
MAINMSFRGYTLQSVVQCRWIVEGARVSPLRRGGYSASLVHPKASFRTPSRPGLLSLCTLLPAACKIILSSILTAQARGDLTARRNVARLAVPATPRPGGSLNQTFVLGALRVATQHHRLH